MTRSEYIELRAELRHAADVRLDRMGDDRTPRIFNARRTKAGKMSVQILRGIDVVWEPCQESDEIVVYPCSRNEYKLMAYTATTKGAR